MSLEKLNPIYNYSLGFFLKIFQETLEDIELPNEEIPFDPELVNTTLTKSII